MRELQALFLPVPVPVPVPAGSGQSDDGNDGGRTGATKLIEDVCLSFSLPSLLFSLSLSPFYTHTHSHSHTHAIAGGEQEHVGDRPEEEGEILPEAHEQCGGVGENLFCSVINSTTK